MSENYFNKFKQRKSLFDGRERGELAFLAEKGKFFIEDYAILTTKKGPNAGNKYLVFTVEGMGDVFFYGSKPMLKTMQQIDRDGMRDAVSDQPVCLQNVFRTLPNGEEIQFYVLEFI